MAPRRRVGPTPSSWRPAAVGVISPQAAPGDQHGLTDLPGAGRRRARPGRRTARSARAAAARSRPPRRRPAAAPSCRRRRPRACAQAQQDRRQGDPPVEDEDRDEEDGHEAITPTTTLSHAYQRPSIPVRSTAAAVAHTASAPTTTEATHSS